MGEHDQLDFRNQGRRNYPSSTASGRSTLDFGISTNSQHQTAYNQRSSSNNTRTDNH